MDEPQTTIKKSDWGPGPWQEEPDRVEWESYGLPCLMVRDMNFGHWCGYAAVPLGHPLHGVWYDQCTQGCPPEKYRLWACGNYEHCPGGFLTAHNGLVFSGFFDDLICHTPKPGQPENVSKRSAIYYWWFGFGCVSVWDMLPGIKDLMVKLARPAILVSHQNYRDLAYVRNQVENLARQLAEYVSQTKVHP